MMGRRREPIGAILAGGSGRRIGGSKAIVALHGTPLIAYPLQAMRGALLEVAVVAKADTKLPSLAGATVWIEPNMPRHPLVGIMHALALAEGRPILVCAADLPFVTSELIRALASVHPGAAPAVIAASDGHDQPLLGCYQPEALDRLQRAGFAPDVPVRDCIAALDPLLLEVDDPQLLFNVKSPDDLLQAAAMLDVRRPRPARSYPNVKS
jgi:molybdopterin-guanine dinucleotide biosynthesis protein A